MQEQTLADLRAHAAECAPAEACGLVIVEKGREKYIPCKNVAPLDEFEIATEDYVAAADRGEIVAIAHSHVNAPATPSMVDLVGCEHSCLPWVIVSHPHGDVVRIEPKGYEAPLVGRPYCYGVLDCYTLVVDYYRRELGIELPHFDEPFGWWERGEPVFESHLDEAGFVIVEGPPRQHDALLLDFGAKGNATHCAVYLGDDLILHHCVNRLSSRDVYGRLYQQQTMKVARHKSLL